MAKIIFNVWNDLGLDETPVIVAECYVDGAGRGPFRLSKEVLGDAFGVFQNYVGQGPSVQAALEDADDQSEWLWHVVDNHYVEGRENPACQFCR